MLYSNLIARFRQKVVLGLRLLSERAGQRSMERRLFQLQKGTSLLNERCRLQLVAKLQRLNEQGGPRSSKGRKAHNRTGSLSATAMPVIREDFGHA